MKRILITAMESGSGKTVVSCGLMRAFQKRGLTVRAFKCGPDYIDPMFHTRVIGVPSRNLDLFLQGKKGVLRTLARENGDVAVLEGAMGFYDGKNGTPEASAWETADVTGTPALLVVRPGAQSVTLAAQIRGVTAFRTPSRLAALLLTDCRPKRYAQLKDMLEKETGLPVAGYLPPMEEAKIPSRHLGLVTAREIGDLNTRFDRIAEELEEHTDLDLLLSLAAQAENMAEEPSVPDKTSCTIAVARDEAFCFYYEDNLDLLRESGARIIPFSPVHDTRLPDADGLYLGGGYPELYAKELSANVSMRQSVRKAVMSGMPTVAECGGFLYLQEFVKDGNGDALPMAGVFPGAAEDTGRLQRFGYLTVSADRDSLLFRKGETVPAHEFHYWDCSDCGAEFKTQKADGRTWRFGFAGPDLYAGFPHLHFGGETPFAQRFAGAAAAYAAKREVRL